MLSAPHTTAGPRPLRWLVLAALVLLLVWQVWRLADPDLLGCADVLWRLADGSPRYRLLAWGVALSFYPTLSALRMACWAIDHTAGWPARERGE